MRRLRLFLVALVGLSWSLASPAHELLEGSVDYTVSVKVKSSTWAAVVGKGSDQNFQVDLDYDPNRPQDTHVVVKINVFSFTSNNQMRDSHMLEALEAYVHPYVQWDARVVQVLEDRQDGDARVLKLRMKGPFEARGTSAPLQIDVPVRVEGERARVDAQFVVDLNNYFEKLPSLLGIHIDNEMPARVHFVFHLDPPPAPEPTATEAPQGDQEERP